MKLRIIGDEVLTQISTPIEKIDESLQELVKAMFATMEKAGGVGLAAPQVGINKRLFIVKIDNENEYVFINPEIIETSEETSVAEEGCLSIPSFYADVCRSRSVRVQYLDINGRRRTLEAEGLLAKAIQHEIDHLNGILFVDRLSEEIRQAAIEHVERVKKKIEKKAKKRIRARS